MNSSPACILGESAIHGRGVFAARDIRAGERLLEYQGRRISAAAAARLQEANAGAPIYLFELGNGVVIDGDVPENLAKYINHSCAENCEVRPDADGAKIWIYASADIPAGAELSFDYAFSITAFWEHPCRCGAANCPGYIVSKLERQKLRSLLSRSRRKLVTKSRAT